MIINISKLKLQNFSTVEEKIANSKLKQNKLMNEIGAEFEKKK